ncbi:type II secretion system pseudopilin PulG [Massilia eurypsychrophila]|jgi:type II secretory pathway pseudopilin PulG|uniref:Type II secretion system pseudopilin PulG n=1 Tax=Massilia eurypsychrophila TaxID=1485217 RepID=A0A2G8TFC7_9BURK|nr:type II secretion system protein [Massilia eurypsychrophila]PIL44742.1 type II secretion system pseudopilin PulG [Massilia eurypsychrophila]
MARRTPSRHHGGFTYLGLIVLVTVIGLVGAATLKIDSLMRRAAAEEELLDIGAAFSNALDSYAAATPQGQPLHPPSLNELLKDPRTPGVRRHLRKIFVDPVTGSAEWGIVYRAGQVGVVAVHSLSKAPPLKIGNFAARFVGFENKQHLSDWKFTAGAVVPSLPATSPQLAAPEPEVVTPVAAPVAEQPVMQEVVPPPPAEPAAEPEEQDEEPAEAGKPPVRKDER